MNIIVPMAGMGKRMRPHTLTVPKPLIPVAGKPIVQHLVEDIAAMCQEKIDEVAFVIGDFGPETEAKLLAIAEGIGAKGRIFYQEEALGTAHAVHCAKECLHGNLIVAFADTIFRADFKLDASKDGVIWVNKVENPEQFGVVKVDENNHIYEFVEKPSTFVSDLAIIGIYYFKDGDNLCKEIEYLIDNDIKDKGEYQLTNALENMKNKGLKFEPGKVDEWLDCGNKNATVHTNQRVLAIKDSSATIDPSAEIINSVIIPPVFIGKNARIENSVIGPYTSLGEKTRVERSLITNSIVQTNAHVHEANVHTSMVGNFSVVEGKAAELSISDYSTIRT
ncbi:MAG: NTP transferase domain-containing protein [Bacteroidota bacterium]|nr:NTP transferase domain-containing protein [Bacteroidota bacterium]MDX5429699.1 NTP transferase domain-containing protein [Bacteroidota bacterium]MDX5468480.1 NTP transferase domain-containing protein [Bacteroidota bacterium]